MSSPDDPVLADHIAAAGACVRPLEPGADAVGPRGGLQPEDYLLERYIERPRASKALGLYYTFRPLIPRRVQIGMRRAYATRQRRRVFPSWPIEDVLVNHQDEEFRRQIAEHDARGAPFVHFWPNRHRFAFVLTHDIEGSVGVKNIARVREVEKRHGFVSAWNFCAEQYPIPDGLFDALTADGCEIGLHGIDHRCKLFSSRAQFERNLPRLRHYLDEWNIVGFRSPGLHRNADWMPEIPALYDSSVPDTDPFEPQPGGCCSIHPFINRGQVELPVTLAQDHTLFEILRHKSIAIWIRKCDWIIEHYGLINVIVHPDYMVAPGRLALYEELLVFLRAQEGGWHALPRDVAQWWKRRAELRCEPLPDGRSHIVGPQPDDATIAYARDTDGRIVIDI